MAKVIHDDVFDAALAEVATCTRMVVFGPSGTAPADVAACAASLAATALTAGDGNGDFAIAGGAVSGRKVTVAQQASLSVATTGTATHIALHDGTDLLLVTTCTNQLLTSGNTVTVPAFAFEITDPA